MRDVRTRMAGWSIVELVLAIGVSLVLLGVAASALAPMAAHARAAGAARFVAATLRHERLEAVAGGRSTGIRFERAGAEVVMQAVADGNGNGLRSAEIDAGVDRRRGARHRLRDRFAGARFAIATDVPAIDGGAGLAAGADPIRLGSTLLTFAPTGSATSGTLYIASGDDRMFAVRVLGATGRVRVFELDRASGRWVAL
jgi:hypothetical protein